MTEHDHYTAPLEFEHYDVHGFTGRKFRDLYGARCSIQESSLASAPAIWLGCDEGRQLLAWMHLTQAQVRGLLPLLQHFVEHGCLPEVSHD
jgi:hypothetical protein